MKNTLMIRHQYQITGVVQGVGFRPFVYGLATRYQLTGFVYNHSRGVTIEVEGQADSLADFKHALHHETPPLAHIEQVSTQVVPTQGDSRFTIRHSQADPTAHTLISPDMSVCADCLHESLDPTDRRQGYPFTNCTNCGPRFTIIQDIPYDRPQTTMSPFPMCPTCQAEYDDPRNRRFHAQPNACPVCGPQVEFLWSNKKSNEKEVQSLFFVDDSIDGQSKLCTTITPIQQTQHAILQGHIMAIKGLGGFHLACSASDDTAVQTLRQRKGRPDKPFAVMALDLETVKQFAHVDSAEARLLTSNARPIVLLRKRLVVMINTYKEENTPCRRDDLSPHVAPNNPYIGVMLPYTPLHYLLLSQIPKADFQPEQVIVLTSGNYSNEPIITHNDAALERLSAIADGFLFHNRDIHVPCDDSVMRVFQGLDLPIRRSRGYAPFPVKLPLKLPPILAVGGELKATFCLTHDEHAFMSQHIGDMENLETLQAFEQAVSHFKALFRVEPTMIACDLHPSYLSSKWAKQKSSELFESSELLLIKVQHHHAHLAAVMAEHGHDGSLPVIGFSFDGTGYGTDDTIWGGEVMLTDYQQFERVAHLQTMPLPGGDAAIKRPYRLALAYLWQAGLSWDERLPCVSACSEMERNIIKQQLERNLNTVQTSSMGRLFDAVAALLGVRQTVTYEGQAAIEMELLVDPAVQESYSFEFMRVAGSASPPSLWEGVRGRADSDRPEMSSVRPNGLLGKTSIIRQINPTPVLQAIITDLHADLPISTITAKFHNAVADLILQLSLILRQETGLNQVALSGGVFQNVTLLTGALKRLQAHQFEVLTHQTVPPNDGGLALGQAIIAGHVGRET
ncbi:carbamoyltransferase HypF [Anaerolineales bacterium HSG25]|nr:carbamoyltransferase HypF [Anaerolineales bacterium HSG25]